MRGSLGATKRERILADNRWRQVALVQDADTVPRVVRRIRATVEGVDLVDRASALGLIRGIRVPGFAMIEDRAIVGGTLEIAESFVDGFTLGSAIFAARQAVSVSVAIALVHDLARGLTVIHSIREPTGRPAKLIHGRLDIDQVMLSPNGDVHAIGIEGIRGEPSADVNELLKILHGLLVAKASTKAGGSLLQRLAQLKFESAEQMSIALAAYLGRQNDGELSAKRLAFVSELASKIGWQTALEQSPAIQVPETATDANMRTTPLSVGNIVKATQRTTLGASARVELDEEGDGPTVTDGAPVIAGMSERATIEGYVDRAARDGLLGPASPPQEQEKKQTVSVGNYRVVASIGRGGMGEIYLAKPVSNTPYRGLVALKILGLDDSGDEEALGMFIDEAAIMAHIDHPNVLKVVDFGRAKGRHFLAMEYLEGRPLVRVMIDAYQKLEGLDFGLIASIGADAARGLFAAHTATTPQGKPLMVVHRDISPQNIFICYDGLTKVIDFGVARATQRVSKTAVGVVKGKAAYMSPEQTEGREVDARSDVFSLGVCLWEMTAGRRLFKRDTEYETLMAVSTAPIDKPTQIRGQPNAALDRVILASLTRNRDKRTQTALELAMQLQEFAKSAGVSDAHKAVSDLMKRLFGSAAEEERALIRRLEARAATEQEVDSLRRLSGVSPRKGAKPEITIVGSPSGLLELDSFGTESSGRVLAEPGEVDTADGAPGTLAPGTVFPKPTSAGAAVLKAVGEVIAEKAAHDTPSVEILLNAEVVEELDPTAVGDKAPDMVPTPANPRFDDGLLLALDSADKIPSVLGTPTLPPGSVRSKQATPREVAANIVALTRSEHSTTAKRPAYPPARSRSVRWIAMLSLIGLFGGVIYMMRARDTDEARDRKPFEVGAASKTKTSSTAQLHVADEDEREPPRPQRPTTRLREIAIVPESESATTASTIKALLDDMRARHFNVSASQGTYLLDDGKENTVVIDGKGEVFSVSTPSAQGWIVQTSARGLTQVVWIGSVDKGPYFARPLSVNDCAARVRVTPDGLTLRYGERQVGLPHGGGSLFDVSLTRPPDAERLEIEPLHLAFGARGPGRALRCSTGWWGGHVVLRSLPEGTYTLRWVGGDESEYRRLEIGKGKVRGGKLVRTSSVAR
jgi:hypothetical protein